MKIGILTYHAACNFGANLQALSTISYWRNCGHEPVFINWVTRQLEERYRHNTPSIQFSEHEAFRKQFFPMTIRCYSTSDIAKVVEKEEIKAIIVGSDAVLQTRPLRSRLLKPTFDHPLPFTFPPKDNVAPNPFWGSFYSKLKHPIPICLMSASSQNSPYQTLNRFEKRIQRDLLLQFSYISTRDDWTSKMVSYITDGYVNPTITPDPVFAFNYNVKKQPSELEIRKKFHLPERYSLVCFHKRCPVSIEWLMDLKKEQSKQGVDCIAFPFPQGIEFKHPFDYAIDLPLSPLDWYALIKYADSYIGDNMHPIVISLHNAVPCYSFDHYGCSQDETSSKIYHIMNRFGVLKNHIAFRFNYTQPTVEHVLGCIKGFDKVHVRACAEEYLGEYLQMMTNITQTITKYKYENPESVKKNV